MRLIRTVFAASLLLVASPALHAQAFPAKPLKLLVAFPPGTPPDIIGRVIAQQLGEGLGQQLVVENRPGVGGTLGAMAAAAAPADGYTLHLGSTGSLAVGPALFPKIGLDPVAAFAPISLVGSASLLLSVAANVPAANLAQFLALVRSQPGKINYASAGPGSVPHIFMEMIKSQAAPLDIVHIPYKGAQDAHAAILNGDAQAMVDQVATLAPHLRAGKMRALAVTRRSAQLPDVPTFAELGLAGLDGVGWFGLLAPRGTPGAIIERLHAETQRSLAAPSVRERLAHFGFESGGSTPAEFGAFLAREIDRWGRAVRASGARVD